MTTSTLTDYIVRGGRNSEGRPMRNPYNKSQVYDTVAGPLDPSNLTVFITNLVENCKTGGYFIGTCYDGKRVFELLTDRESIEYRDAMDNLVYRISKQYDMTEFGSQLFGNRIDVYMDSIDSEYSEYLVDFEQFVSIMKQNGFELVKPAMKPEYDIFQGPMNSFSTILSQLSSFESNSQFRKYYSASLELQSIPELQLLSSLNNYFIFKKN